MSTSSSGQSSLRLAKVEETTMGLLNLLELQLGLDPSTPPLLCLTSGKTQSNGLDSCRQRMRNSPFVWGFTVPAYKILDVVFRVRNRPSTFSTSSAVMLDEEIWLGGLTRRPSTSPLWLPRSPSMWCIMPRRVTSPTRTPSDSSWHFFVVEGSWPFRPGPLAKLGLWRVIKLWKEEDEHLDLYEAAGSYGVWEV